MFIGMSLYRCIFLFFIIFVCFDYIINSFCARARVCVVCVCIMGTTRVVEFCRILRNCFTFSFLVRLYTTCIYILSYSRRCVTIKIYVLHFTRRADDRPAAPPSRVGIYNNVIIYYIMGTVKTSLLFLKKKF